MSNESVTRQFAETSEETRRLHHANRLFAVLSAVNRSIIRRPPRSELLGDICRILVETGGFLLAWFGSPDVDGWVVPEASYGDPQGYLGGIRISVNDIPEGRGPTGTTIRENRPVICNNIPINPLMEPWREKATRYNINSSACFPVCLPTGAIAGLTLYSTELDFFSPDEEKLLTDIANDIGYALEFIAAEERRGQAEQRLEYERTLLKTLVRTIPDLIWLKDQDGVYLSCNPAFESFFGATEAEITGKSDYDFVSRELADFFRARDREAMEAGKPSRNQEWVTFAADGHSALLETIKTPMLNSDGTMIGVLGIARDITAIRMSEQSLREREDRHRVILQTAPDGFWLLDREGYLQEVNNAYCRMSGYRPEELLTMRITDLEAAETPDETAEHILKTIVQGEDRFETRHRRKDGTIFDAAISSKYRPADGGQFVVFIQDITIRKQVEAELRESRRSLERTQSIAKVGGWTTDLRSGMSVNSPEASLINGLPTHEIPWDQFFAVVNPEDAPLLWKAWDEALTTGKPYETEFRISVAGQDKWVHSLAEFEYDADGTPVRAIGMIQDISEQITAQLALRDSEEQHRTILQTAMDGFWLTDMEGGLLEVNDAYCRMSGYSAQELLAMRVSDLETADVLPHIQKAIAQGEDRFESRHRRKDGSFFHVEISIQYQQAKGGRLVGFLRDITERKKTEEAVLQAKETAEEANRAKSRFLANMSHELRTPLNGVLGMIQIVKYGRLDDEQRSSLDLALSSGFSLVRILDDILDVAKIEAGRLALEQKQFSLRETVSGIVSLLLPEAVRKRLRLIVNMADTLPPVVTGDPFRLRQVLTNLIGNAIKFTSEGTVEVLVTHSPDGIAFTVTDTGIGIPVEKRHLLFQPFSQVDDSTTRSYGGTGLGLLISQEIVGLMGGNIVCDSIPGVGSRFMFTIPFGIAEPDATAEESSLSPAPDAGAAALPGHEPRILVVEDEPTNQELLKRTFKRENFTVDTADNGRDALNKLLRQKYDLIIMDVLMPVMDGITATQIIREQEQVTGSHIPILAMTAFASDSDRDRCLDAGMDGFVSKPVDLNEVIGIVRKLLHNTHELSG